MSESTEYKRGRSVFWMRINENDDGGFNFFVSQSVSSIVKHHFPELEQASPTGWKVGKSRTENIWIPPDRADQIDINEIKEWAEFAGNQCVWLNLGKHLQDHFNGEEIDFCIASDFNFTTDGSGNIGPRSALGEAVNKLKYHHGEISPEDRQKHGHELTQALPDMFDLLPLTGVGTSSGPIVSPIPAEDGHGKLAWACARFLAKNKGAELIEPKLLLKKPEMKGLSFDKKIEIWKAIYQDENSIDLDPARVQGRDIVIVDDLYQSGTTMWAYAEKLKRIGARHVFGLACVKSMRDSDNQ